MYVHIYVDVVPHREGKLWLVSALKGFVGFLSSWSSGSLSGPAWFS